ncbi:MAG: sensor histidine kinase [Ignavibacteriaceae bacterium]
MKSRLIFLIPIIVLIATISFLIFLHTKNKEEVIKFFQTEQVADSHQLAREIKSYLNNRAKELNSLSSLTSLQNPNMEEMASDVKTYFDYEKNNQIKAISVFDENGKVIYSTNKSSIGRNYKGSDFIHWAENKGNRGKCFVTSLENFSISRLHLVVPIYQEEKNKSNANTVYKFKGAAASTIVLDSVIPGLFHMVSVDTSNETIIILDNNGTVLFQNKHPEMVYKNIYNQDKTCFTCHKSFDNIKTILSSKEGSINYELKGRPQKIASYFSMETMNISWKIVLGIKQQKVGSFINSDLNITLILIGVVTLSLTGAFILAARNNQLKIKAEEEANQWKEKTRLQEKLNEAQGHYKSVVDSSPDAIVIHSEGKIVFVNFATLKLVGASSSKELIGKASLDFIHPDEREFASKRFLEALKSGKVLPMTEERFIKLDGSVIYVEEVSQQVIFNGKPAIQTIVHDITVRKRTQSELQIMFEITNGLTTNSNQDELLGMIHHALQRAIYAENFFIALYDENTGLFSFPYFVDKFDPVPSPTAMGKSCTAYVFRSGKPLLLTTELFEHLEKIGEVELVGSNSPSWIGVPLQTSSKTIGVLVLQHYEKENVYSENDVNFLVTIGNQIAIVLERKIAEEEIKNQNKKLTLFNAEKDKFFSIIAHDLKSPFMGFINLTEIMADSKEEFSQAEFIEYSKSLNEAARHLYKLLENLLEWAQMQKGSISFSPKEFDLSSVVLQNIGITWQRALQKGITIINEVPAAEIVYADEKMIDTVLRNLISNAVKFTRKDGKVVISSNKINDDMVKISVSDTGVGIPEKDADKLFKIEGQLRSKGTEGEPSTGLGLVLCKEFVEKNGGKIWVESKENVGSTFYFTLPVVG